MKLQTLSIALVTLLLGTTSAPVEVRAEPPSWAPAHGWHKQKNVDKRKEKAAAKAAKVETRSERAEARELRALRLRDPNATTSDLNRSQATKLERQNRREAAAQARRDQARRDARALRRQQALRP